MTKTYTQTETSTSAIMLAIAGQMAATSSRTIARLLEQRVPARRTGLSFIDESESRIVIGMNAAALALYGHDLQQLTHALTAINIWVSSCNRRTGTLEDGLRGEQLINWSFNALNTQADFAQAKAAAIK